MQSENDPAPGADDLADMCALALSNASSTCTPECHAYHAVWGLLRLFGNLPGVGLDHAFLLSAIGGAVRDGARRVLISGSADHGVLSYVLAVFDDMGETPDVTVIDLCPTPLLTCTAYAARKGHVIRTEAVDATQFSAPAFDLIIAHNFLNFFSPDDRFGLIRHWRDLLVPGGTVISVSTIKPGAPPRSRRFEEDKALALCDSMARARAASDHTDLIDEATMRALTLDYARRRISWNIASEDELFAPFRGAGFEIDLKQAYKIPENTPTSIAHKYRFGLVAHRT